MKWVATILILTLISSCSFSLFKMPQVKSNIPPDSTTVIKTDSIKGEDLSKPLDALSEKIDKAIKGQEPDSDSSRVFSTYGTCEADYYKLKWQKAVEDLKEIAADYSAFKASYKPCQSVTTTISTKVKEHDGGDGNTSGKQSWAAIIISFVAVIALVIDKLKKKS
jgi:hypothetical protein